MYLVIEDSVIINKNLNGMRTMLISFWTFENLFTSTTKQFFFLNLAILKCVVWEHYSMICFDLFSCGY